MLYATVQKVVEQIQFLPGWKLRLDIDQKSGDRWFIQWRYQAPCVETGEIREWPCRKWYLSEHMLEDEIVKTAFAAALAAMEHEVREQFRYKNVKLFNPHVDINYLMAIADETVVRS